MIRHYHSEFVEICQVLRMLEKEVKEMLWDQLRFTGPSLSFTNWFDLTNLVSFRSDVNESNDNVINNAHQTVFETISDGILVLNQDNHVVSSNPAANRILKSVSPNPAETTDMLNNQHVNSILSMWPTLRAYLNSTSREYVTSVQSCLRDLKRSFDIHVTPVTDADGLFCGRIILIQETTERENAERALRQRKQQLRLMVERLQQVDRSRSHAINNLDVELHSSLTRIDLHLNNLRKGVDDGLNDAINRLEIEISNLYKRVEPFLEQDNWDYVTGPQAVTPSRAPSSLSRVSKTLA